MNRTKRTKNLFSIDRSTDEVPLNHSITLDSSFVKKSPKKLVLRLKNNSPKSKSKINIPNFKKKNINSNIYLTDLGTPIKGNQNKLLKNILLTRDLNKSNEKSFSRAQSSPSSGNRSISIYNKNEKNSVKGSPNFKNQNNKYIPFNSATFRDCGEKFILNENPGVGLYNLSKSPYYCKYFIIYYYLVKKEFNSMFTKNNEKQKMRNIWNDRFLCRGYKHVNFN